MTRRPLQFVALVALASCQVGEPTGPSKVDPPPSLAIEDGAHSAGNPDFFFLLPLVLPTSSYSNWTHDGFNRSLSPSVEICRLVATTAAQVATVAGSQCRATPAPVIIEGTDVKKHFPPAADPSDVLTGLPGDWAHYHAKWPIPNNCNNTFFYRVRARVGSVELGFADVKCVTNLFQLLFLDYRKFGAAFKGKMLQIPFRIERYALCETPGVGPCGTASVTLTEESVTELRDPETGVVIGSVTIPVQDVPSTPDPVVVNVEGCDDLRDRVVSPLDLPTFGPCLRITTDPEIVLSNAATIFICTIAGTSGGQNVGTVSEDQEDRITIHRRDELPTPSVHALPHVAGCPVVGTISVDRSLKGLLAAVAKGRWKDAGGRLLNIMGPTPLYARRFIDVGGGGFSLEFSDFQLALPGSLEISDGDGQTALPGSTLPIPAEVTVRDVGGEPVGGARVRFLASAGGQPSSEIVVSSGATSGVASTSWTLSSTAGPNTLVARGFGLGGTDFSGPRATVDPFQSIQPPFDPGPSVPPLQEVPLAVGSVTFNATGAGIIDGAEADAGWTMTGFWHRSTLMNGASPIVNSAYPGFVTSASGDASAGALPNPFLGSYVFWYGEEADGNYLGTQAGGDAANSGGTSTGPNAGTLTSPAFLAPADGVLRFNTWFELESVDVHAFDLLRISIEVVGGSTTLLGQLNPAVDQNGPANVPFTSGGLNTAPVWREDVVDLSAYAGQEVRLIFEFNSVDVLYNGFRGWLVDNVRVASEPTNLRAFGAALVAGKNTLNPPQPLQPRTP